MSESREPPGRIVVAGAGQVGVLAAIAMKRALPRSEVVVLGLPPDPAAFAEQAASALPFTNGLHDRLGIEEPRIVGAAGGSHRLVLRYFGWGGQGQGGAMPYGATIDPALRTAFARDWGGGPRNAAGALPAGSLAEALADAGRFCVAPEGTPTPLAEVDYALRWNPAAYRDMLISIAQQLGVVHEMGELVAAEPDGVGGIAALSVAGAGRIAGDLFLDCSGTAARLLARLPGYRGEDWSAELPVRRVLAGKPGGAMLALEDRLTLLPEGWLSEQAGRDGLRTELGIAPGVDEQAAVAALGVEPLAMLPVEPGRAAEAWIGNVVALGDAAARFEPLAGLNLDLAHRQIDLLLEMLPGRTIEPLERSEYNRRFALMADAVRDTLGAHYAAPAARAVFGDPKRSPQLEAALDQFVRRGRMPFREEAPLLSQEFQAMLAALGFAPGEAPQARAAGRAETEAAQRVFADKARAALSFAPPYGEWMAGMLGASRARPG